MGVNTRRYLADSIYMDDICLPLYDPAGDLSKMVEEVDTGLKNANFEVKEWAETGNTNITVKFLSYSYNPMKNTFSVRPKINWSAKKRGARKSPDVTNVEELKQHIKNNGMTRRSVSSILMGTLHDPLQLMAPFINNLKLVYRDICRLKMPWDEKIPENMMNRIIEALSYFFKMETIELAEN